MDSIEEEWEAPVNFDVVQVDIGLQTDYDSDNATTVLESRSELGNIDQLDSIVSSIHLPTTELNPYFDYDSLVDTDSDADSDFTMTETDITSVTTDGVDSNGHPVHVFTRRRVTVPRHIVTRLFSRSIEKNRRFSKPRDLFYFKQYDTDHVILPFEKSDEKKEFLLEREMKRLYGGDDYFGLSDVESES